MKIRLRNPFSRDRENESKDHRDDTGNNENENVIEHDKSKQVQSCSKDKAEGIRNHKEKISILTNL